MSNVQDNQFKGKCWLDLGTIIDSGSIEGFLEALEESLANAHPETMANRIISNYSYNVVSHKGNSLEFEVEGDLEEL